jgi:hypothetical protein
VSDQAIERTPLPAEQRKIEESVANQTALVRGKLLETRVNAPASALEAR